MRLHPPFAIAPVPLLILILLFSASASVAPVLASPVLPRVERLENGLTVVLLEDHSAPLVAAAVWVHVGSKDESEELAGFAHYLEHLIPQGTKDRAPRQEQLEVFRSGGISRIAADYDRTFFFVEAGKSFLEAGLEDLFRLVTQADLSGQSVDRIRPALTRELQAAYAEPQQVLFLEQMRAAFPEQPYRIPSYGSFASLADLDHKPAEAFYANFYVPNNMVVAVGGDIDRSRTLGKIRQLFGSLKPSKTLPPKPKFESALAAPRQVVKKLGSLPPSVSLLIPTPGYRHPDRYALAVLARLLEEGSPSRLTKRLSEPRLLALSPSSRFLVFEERGLLAISALPLSPGSTSDAGQALLAAVKSAREEGFPEAEVRRVVKKMRLEAAVRRDALGPLVQDLAEAALFGDVRYGWELESNLAAVGSADVRRVAQTYLHGRNTETLVILPNQSDDPSPESLEALAKAVSTLGPETDSSDPARPDFTAAMFGNAKLPPLAPHGSGTPASRTTRTVFPNGLILLIRPERQRGLVSLSLQIRAGTAFDPPGREGLAQTVASALSTGPRSMSPREFQGRRADLGSTFGVSASREPVEAGLTVFPEDLPEALRFLSAPLLEPRFTEDQMGALRDRIRKFSEARSGSPADQVRDLLRQKIFRGHPYARPLIGNDSALASIGPADLAAFFRRYYRPDRAVLTLAGDLDLAAAQELARGAFAGWTVPDKDEAPSELPDDAAQDAESGEVSRLVEALPTVVAIGFPGVPLKDPEFPMLRALGTVLSAQGFLEVVLRQPLAFSVTAVPEGLSQGGMLSVESETTPAEASRVAYELMLRARTLVLKEVTPETIADLKIIEKVRLLREKESLYTLASNLGFYELMGAGYAAYDRAPPLPDDLTPAALKKAAGRFLDPSHFVRATAGPLPR